MVDGEHKKKWILKNISKEDISVFEFYAHCIIDEEDYDKKFKIIVDMQVEIMRLNRQFTVPLSHFMNDHKHLIENELDKALYTKTNDYQARPERMVKDLLNFVYCLAGYGAFYQCPTECTHED